MTDDFADVRAALDAVLVPATAPVDLAAIYRADHERQIRLARRWKRITVGSSALAAGVILLALVPKLDVRCNADEFAVRWGQPPAVVIDEKVVPVPQPDPRLPALIAEQHMQVTAMRATDLKYAEMQELLLALTTDVAERDKVQLGRIAALAGEIRAFQLATAKRFDQTEKTNTTLYNVVFNAKP